MYSDIFIKSNEITVEISNFLGLAIEVDEDIASLIINFADSLNEIGNDYAKRERSKENFFNYQTDILSLLGLNTECDDIRKNILKNIIQHLRFTSFG